MQVGDPDPGVEGGLIGRAAPPRCVQSAAAVPVERRRRIGEGGVAGQDHVVHRLLDPRGGRRGEKERGRSRGCLTGSPESGSARPGPRAPDAATRSRAACGLAAVPEDRLQQGAGPAVVQVVLRSPTRGPSSRCPTAARCAIRSRWRGPRAGGRPAPRPCRAAEGQCRARSAGSSARGGPRAGGSRTWARGRRGSRPRRTPPCRAAPAGRPTSRRAGTPRLRL